MRSLTAVLTYDSASPIPSQIAQLMIQKGLVKVSNKKLSSGCLSKAALPAWWEGRNPNVVSACTERKTGEFIPQRQGSG